MLWLAFLKQCFGEGYSEVISDPDQMTNDLIKNKLIIPVSVDKDNMEEMKTRLLDFHSCMLAGKFFVITNDIEIAFAMESTSFKIIGKGYYVSFNTRDILNNFEYVIKNNIGPSIIKNIATMK